MKFQELKKSLANGLKNLYYIKGDDAFLRHKAQEMIENSAVSLKDLNIVRFDDENANAFDIVNACQILPMMDKYRVVVVKGGFKKADEIKPIIEYAKKPTTTTVLIVVDNGANPNLYKSYSSIAELVDCSKLDSALLSRLVLSELAPYKTKINSDAMESLLSICNFDFTRINNEVIKLANLVGTGETITKDDVLNNVAREIEYDIFELSNAVSVKQGAKALEIIKNLLERKESPQMLLMLIQSTFRRMFYAIGTKESNAEIASKLGVKEYSIKIARDQASRFTLSRLKSIIELGEKLDFDIKSGNMNDENALLYFITNICG